MATAFPFLLSNHADFVPHPPSYCMGKGGSYPGVQRAGHEFDYPTSSDAQVKGDSIDAIAPQHAFKTYTRTILLRLYLHRFAFYPVDYCRKM